MVCTCYPGGEEEEAGTVARQAMQLVNAHEWLCSQQTSELPSMLAQIEQYCEELKAITS